MSRWFVFLFLICIGLSWNISGFSQLSQQSNDKTSSKSLTSKLMGKVVWEGFDLSHTNVSVYRDEKLRELYSSGLSLSSTGSFELNVEPGRYFIVAYVDLDGSGKFDEGDGYGVFGISDWEDESQKHQSIDVGTNAELKNIQIPITARLQRLENKHKLVSVSMYQPSEFQRFTTELSKATSGCRGILKSELKLTNMNQQMIVLAYTDTSWKYRAGISLVDNKSGSWELRLKPGKYYLMAIYDRNSSNRLDDGDVFGFYGVPDINKQGAFPVPVLIQRNTFSNNLEIHANAVYNTLPKTDNTKTNAYIAGRVLPIPDPDKEVRIEVYPTSALVNPVASGIADKEGRFTFKLPIGGYYIIANHDKDGDGRYSKGDTLGGWGTNSISINPPKLVVLTEGETRTINIQMSAQYDTNGQLTELTVSDEPSLPRKFGEGSPSEEIPDGTMGSITGKITSFFSNTEISIRDKNDSTNNDLPKPDGLLSLSTSPKFRNPTWMPLFLDEDGTFLVDVQPGKYYLMAVVDVNKDGQSGTSDGIGIFGTHQPVRGNPASITVFPGKTTSHVDIDIMASYVDEKGTMAELSDGGQWNIVRMYGKPEDIFKYTQNGKSVEEWMYWTRGLGFTFEADGSGWKLKDQNEFKPNSNAIQQEVKSSGMENENNNNLSDEDPINVNSSNFSLAVDKVSIFYSHDGVLWRIAPSTGIIQSDNNSIGKQLSAAIDSSVAPLGAGYNPSVSENGALVYHDLDDNVILQDVISGNRTILLDNRELAHDVTLSPDGEYIAYSFSESPERSRILIRHLRTDKIFQIPSTAMEMTNPSWRKDGKMIAYTTAGTIENPNQQDGRNIYAYDQVNNRIDPMVISSADDAEPTWHPTDTNSLAFSRSKDGQTRQIWLVTYSDGEPTERQITDMGGSKPVWVPPHGNWIIYENNGQLWTVDIHKPGSESPLMSNGKVVFGYQPFAIASEE
ncbi:hypothetical protein C6497_02080 [Candidatus Poribacteria bacterium]|nr:MAG: hypothetical protein C6497_02080 [Candidatus Poribacteria bacterium]